MFYNVQQLIIIKVNIVTVKKKDRPHHPIMKILKWRKNNQNDKAKGTNRSIIRSNKRRKTRQQAIRYKRRVRSS